MRARSVAQQVAGRSPAAGPAITSRGPRGGTVLGGVMFVVYLLVAFCSYPLLAIYGRLADRFSQRALLALTSLASAAVLLAG